MTKIYGVGPEFTPLAIDEMPRCLDQYETDRLDGYITEEIIGYASAVLAAEENSRHLLEFTRFW